MIGAIHESKPRCCLSVSKSSRRCFDYNHSYLKDIERAASKNSAAVFIAKATEYYLVRYHCFGNPRIPPLCYWQFSHSSVVLFSATHSLHMDSIRDIIGLGSNILG